jgi:hypothetical protein
MLGRSTGATVAALLVLLCALLGRPMPFAGLLADGAEKSIQQSTPLLVCSRPAEAAQILPSRAGREARAIIGSDAAALPPQIVDAACVRAHAAIEREAVRSLSDSGVPTAWPRGPPAA